MDRLYEQRSFETYRRAFYVTLLGVAGIAALYFVGQGLGFMFRMVSDSLLEFLSLLLFLSAFSLARRYRWEWKGLIPRFWVAASFSAMFLFTAISVWNIRNYIGGGIFPHWLLAAALLLLSFSTAIYALTLYVGAFREALKGRVALIAYSSVLITGMAVAAFIVYPIILSNVALYEKLLMAVVALQEYTILALAILGVGIFLGGSFARAWLVFSLGITLLMAGSLLLFHWALAGAYHSIYLGNMCVASGLALTALSFHIHRREI